MQPATPVVAGRLAKRLKEMTYDGYSDDGDDGEDRGQSCASKVFHRVRSLANVQDKPDAQPRPPAHAPVRRLGVQDDFFETLHFEHGPDRPEAHLNTGSDDAHHVLFDESTEIPVMPLPAYILRPPAISYILTPVVEGRARKAQYEVRACTSTHWLQR
jgi:hypothetical protein